VPAAQLRSARIAAAPEIAPQQTSVLGPRAGEASRAPRPPASVSSRPVVARTAPPPAPVPFERQQAELKQNPGRPLPSANVEQLRQNAPARNSRVRVVDMGKVERVQPTVGAEPQEGVRQANPAASTSPPNPQHPNGQQRPSPLSVPARNNRPNESPSNAAGRQNGRRATPVARPDAPSSVVAPLQQNEPPATVNRRQQNDLPAGVVQQPSTPPPAADNRASESPSNAAGRPNGRRATPVARPDAPSVVDTPRRNEPPASVDRRQRNEPPARVVQQPGTPRPAADNRTSAPPPNQQQSARRERAAVPVQPNRPQQVDRAQVERQQPGSRRKAAEDKTDKNDEKK
jgi:hypothetical protein